MSIFRFSYQVAVGGLNLRPDYQADVLPPDHPAPVYYTVVHPASLPGVYLSVSHLSVCVSTTETHLVSPTTLRDTILYFGSLCPRTQSMRLRVSESILCYLVGLLIANVYKSIRVGGIPADWVFLAFSPLWPYVIRPDLATCNFQSILFFSKVYCSVLHKI